MITSSYPSIDPLIHLIDRLALCLFCTSQRTKTDNLSRFVYEHVSLRPHAIPILNVLLDSDCELEGNWLEKIPLIGMGSLVHEIQRHLNPMKNTHAHRPRSMNNSISPDRTSDLLDKHRESFRNRPVVYWSSDEVSQWCKTTQGNFDTLLPLVKRLNGSALVHLAEILSIEPASMYHSLNDELLQRTGTSVPITEYVSLRSELQRLLTRKPNLYIFKDGTETPIEIPTENVSRKKRWRKSRLCVLS